MERCEDCGFVWESVPASDVGERTRRGARIAELLQANVWRSDRRRIAGRLWSTPLTCVMCC